MRYRVSFYQDGIYEVVDVDAEEDDNADFLDKYVFKGSLSDCEAYIRLKQGGLL